MEEYLEQLDDSLTLKGPFGIVSGAWGLASLVYLGWIAIYQEFLTLLFGIFLLGGWLVLTIQASVGAWKNWKGKRDQFKN